MDKKKLDQIHKLSIYNFDQIKSGINCGCFYCLKIYDTKLVNNYNLYIDSQNRSHRTAICSHCEQDSLLSDQIPYILSRELLQLMHDYWFCGAND